MDSSKSDFQITGEKIMNGWLVSVTDSGLSLFTSKQSCHTNEELQEFISWVMDRKFLKAENKVQQMVSKREGEE